jgi:hypothetical protein
MSPEMVLDAFDEDALRDRGSNPDRGARNRQRDIIERTQQATAHGQSPRLP